MMIKIFSILLLIILKNIKKGDEQNRFTYSATSPCIILYLKIIFVVRD